MSDWNEFIQRVLTPKITDTVFVKSIEPFKNLFGVDSYVGGDRIVEKFKMSWTSNAAEYDKTDVNPAISSNVIQKPYWNKKFYHGSAGVHNIDVSNAKNGGLEFDFVSDSLASEVAAMMDVVYSAFLTQLAADVDLTTAYGDGSLSRTTYPTLASEEDATVTTITVPLMREMIRQTRLLKLCGKLNGYTCLMEEGVFNKFKPLAAALHTFAINDSKAGEKLDMGHQTLANFEGLDINDPADFPSMTAGDVYMLRREDVKIKIHRPLEIEAVPSGRDAVEFVCRIGINFHVINPGFQGKMTNKS